ncbi:MAG: hypothetical protein QW258_01170 [Thermoplasmata archaeon]
MKVDIKLIKRVFETICLKTVVKYILIVSVIILLLVSNISVYGYAVHKEDQNNNSYWWNSTFKYRIPITVNAPNCKNLTVTITLNSNNFNYADTPANGTGLAFIYNGNTLPYLIDSWNYGGISNITIFIHSQSAGEILIWLYYDEIDYKQYDPIYYNNTMLNENAYIFNGTVPANVSVKGAYNFEKVMDSVMIGDAISSNGGKLILTFPSYEYNAISFNYYSLSNFYGSITVYTNKTLSKIGYFTGFKTYFSKFNDSDNISIKLVTPSYGSEIFIDNVTLYTFSYITLDSFENSTNIKVYGNFGTVQAINSEYLGNAMQMSQVSETADNGIVYTFFNAYDINRVVFQYNVSGYFINAEHALFGLNITFSDKKVLEYILFNINTSLKSSSNIKIINITNREDSWSIFNENVYNDSNNFDNYSVINVTFFMSSRSNGFISFTTSIVDLGLLYNTSSFFTYSPIEKIHNPDIYIDYPYSGATESMQIQIYGRAYDSIGIKAVYVLWNNKSYALNLTRHSDNNNETVFWSFLLTNHSTLQNQTFKIIAYNNYNISNEKSINITLIQTGVSTVQITSIKNGTIIAGSFNTSISGSSFNIRKLEFQINSFECPISNVNSWSITFNFSASNNRYQSGWYALYIIGTDEYGTVYAYRSINYINIGPTIKSIYFSPALITDQSNVTINTNIVSDSHNLTVIAKFGINSTILAESTLLKSNNSTTLFSASIGSYSVGTVIYLRLIVSDHISTVYSSLLNLTIANSYPVGTIKVLGPKELISYDTYIFRTDKIYSYSGPSVLNNTPFYLNVSAGYAKDIIYSNNGSLQFNYTAPLIMSKMSETIYINISAVHGSATGYYETMVNYSSYPAAPVNLRSLHKYQNYSEFNIFWTDPITPVNITGAFYKIGSAPVNNSDYSGYVFEENIHNLTLNISAGPHTIYIWLENSLDKYSYLENSSCIIIFENTAPKTGSVIVNNGSNYSLSHQLNISISGFSDRYGIARYYYSVFTTLPDKFNVSYSLSFTIDVPADGYYIIEVMAQNYALTNSTPAFTFITVDTVNPCGRLIIDNNATYSNSTTLHLDIIGINGGSQISAMRISQNASFSDSPWITYAQHYNYTVETIQENITIYVQLEAASGRVSSIFFNSIILDLAAPFNTRVVIDFNSRYTNSNNFTLQIFGTDNISGITEMRISTDPNFTDVKWLPYESYYIYHATNISEGFIFIYVQLKDAANNTSPIFYSDIAYLPAPPEAVIGVRGNMINGTAYVNSTNISLIFNVSDGNIPIQSMEISNYPDMNYSTGWIAYQKIYLWHLTQGAGLKTVYAQFKNEFGNSTGLDSIKIYMVPQIQEFYANIPPGYQNSSYYNQTNLTISGYYVDPAPVTIFIDNHTVICDGNRFKYDLQLYDGINNITIRITDAANNSEIIEKQIITSFTAPVINISAISTYVQNNEYVVYSYNGTVLVRGYVNSTILLSFSIDGGIVPVMNNNSFIYIKNYNQGVYYLNFTAIDKSGNIAFLSKRIAVITSAPVILNSTVSESSKISITTNYNLLNITWYLNNKPVKYGTLNFSVPKSSKTEIVTVVVSDPLGTTMKTWTINAPYTISAWEISIIFFSIILLSALYIYEHKKRIAISNKKREIDEKGISSEVLDLVMEIVSKHHSDLKKRILSIALDNGIDLITFNNVIELLESEKKIKCEKDENGDERIYRL